MADFEAPGSVEFLEVLIESPNGKVLDITDLIGELNIYESITTPVLKANVIILDATGLLANLPIMGQEKITGKIKHFDFIDSFEFYTTTVEDIRNVNAFTTEYTINLVEPAYMNNLVSLVSESFTGPVSDMITRISEDYLEVEGDIEPTDGNFKIVVPNWNPYRAIKWLSKKAKNANGVPSILYNTWRGGIKLKSFETLFNQTPVDTFKYQQRRTDQRTAKVGNAALHREMAQTAFVFYPLQQNPIVEVMAKGGYSSRHRLVDTFTKSYDEYDFNIDEYFDEAPSLGKFNPLGKDFKVKERSLGELYSSYEQTRFHSAQSFGLSHYDYSGNMLDVTPFRNSYMSRLSNYRYKIGIYGRGDIEAGSIINIELNKNMIAQEQQTEERVDDRRTGKHVIVNLRHQYTNGSYKLILDAARESMEQDL